MSRMLIEKVQRLLEQETGAICGSLEGRLRFALAFPGYYRLGMSALGLQIVYGLLNNLPNVACERVFLPEPIDEQEYRRSRTRLFSIESQTPICDFDVLAFSVSFEFDYANVARMLDLAGLPISAADRNESHPLIIAGGPCATFNPEPLADIVDVFVIGDAEEVVGELVQAMDESTGKNRDELFERLAQIEGVYVPRFYTPVYKEDGTIQELKVESPAPAHVIKRIAYELDRFNNQSIVLTPNSEFADMTLVETIRGCGRHCRFCVSGYSGRPPRPRTVGELPEGARVGLVGSAVFDHPEAASICDQLASNNRQFSVSSIRMESLTDELASMMFDAGQRTMTIAPEAGSERLRKIINKDITNDQILQAAEITAKAGFPRLKFYFMVGLPEETDEDVDAIAELALEVAEKYPNLKIQISASCFVPKPFTPFQWFGMNDVKTLSNKINRIKKLLSKQKRRIEVSTESPREAHVQGWLARGDRRLGKLIAKCALEDINYAQAARDLDLDTDFYTTRIRSKDEVFPWDHVDLRVDRSYLWNEHENALSGRVTPQCEVGTCKRCGVC